MEYKAYCVKCKIKIDVVDLVEVEMTTKRGMRKMIKGICPVCGTKVAVFIK